MTMRVNVVCPVSGKKIKNAVKGNFCAHPEYIDLSSVPDDAETCPFCGAGFNDLIENKLASFKISIAPPDCAEVEIPNTDEESIRKALLKAGDASKKKYGKRNKRNKKSAAEMIEITRRSLNRELKRYNRMPELKKFFTTVCTRFEEKAGHCQDGSNTSDRP